jgi:hypothetical protein
MFSIYVQLHKRRAPIDRTIRSAVNSQEHEKALGLVVKSVSFGLE